MRSKPTFGANQMTPRLKPGTKPAPKSKIDIWAEEGIENLAGKSWREMQKDREALQDREISERIRRALTSKPVRPFTASVSIQAKCEEQMIQALRILTVTEAAFSYLMSTCKKVLNTIFESLWQAAKKGYIQLGNFNRMLWHRCHHYTCALLSMCHYTAMHDKLPDGWHMEWLCERLQGRHSESLMQCHSMRPFSGA